MERKELLGLLKSLKPAVGSKLGVEVLECFAFTGKQVMAFNDLVAMSAPCAALGIKGCLNSDMLLKWLGSCSSDVVAIEQGETSVIMKCGRSKLELPLLPLEDFPFKKMPTSKDLGNPFELNHPGEFVEAIRFGAHLMEDEGMGRSGITAGITLSAMDKGERIEVFATNGVCMTRYEVPTEEAVDKDSKALIPISFVKPLLSLAKSDMPAKFLVGESWSVVEFDSGVTLAGRMLAEPEVKSIINLWKNVENGRAEPTSVPDEFAAVIKRVAQVCGGSAVTARVKKDKVIFTAGESSPGLGQLEMNGALRDVCSLEGHDEGKLMFNASMLVKMLPISSIVFTFVEDGTPMLYARSGEGEYVQAGLANL